MEPNANDATPADATPAESMTVLELAKSKGYNEEGPKTALEFLEYPDQKGRQVNSEFAEYRRNSDRELRRMQVQLATVNKNLMPSADDALVALETELEEATQGGDYEAVKSVTDRIVAHKTAPTGNNDAANAQEKEAFASFAKENPWVEADKEAAEFCREEIKWLSSNTDLPAAEILKRAGTQTIQEFKHLNTTPGDDEFAPPLGGGRPTNGASNRAFSAKDLPNDSERAELGRASELRSRERGCTVKEAEAHYLKIYKELQG